MKRILSLVLSAVLLLSLCSAVSADDNITFSDVQPQNWFYEAVMAMSGREYALFNGVTKPVDNVGTFSPNTNITRIQFITVLVRLLYSEKLTAAAPKPTPWYSEYYRVAIETGLISSASYPFEPALLNEAITRQETAKLLVKAVEKRGEEIPDYEIYEKSILDYSDIGEEYREYIKKSYLIGLMEGKGESFDPLHGLKRSEAAQVIYRLAEPSKRIAARKYNIVFAQGDKHPPCIAGDIIVANESEIQLKTHGKQNVLLCGNNDTLYDYISGTVINGMEYKEGDASWFDGTELIRDKEYGLLFSRKQWQYLQTALYPLNDGIQIGEVRNNWYVWSTGDSGQNYCWQWFGPEA